MTTNAQTEKRDRGRPRKSEEDLLERGKLTVYLGPLLPELQELADRQHLRCSEFARQAIAVHIDRFKPAA